MTISEVKNSINSENPIAYFNAQQNKFVYYTSKLSNSQRLLFKVPKDKLQKIEKKVNSKDLINYLSDTL